MIRRTLRRFAPLALACACMSCATTTPLRVTTPPAPGPPLGWPPVPVDGYDTADGAHHDLKGGFMIVNGDSVVMFAPTSAARPAALEWAKAPPPVTLHRDSVVAVFPRMEGDRAGSANGVTVFVAVVAVIAALALNPFIWWVWSS